MGLEDLVKVIVNHGISGEGQVDESLERLGRHHQVAGICFWREARRLVQGPPVRSKFLTMGCLVMGMTCAASMGGTIFMVDHNDLPAVGGSDGDRKR